MLENLPSQELEHRTTRTCSDSGRKKEEDAASRSRWKARHMSAVNELSTKFKWWQDTATELLCIIIHSGSLVHILSLKKKFVSNSDVMCVQ